MPGTPPRNGVGSNQYVTRSGSSGSGSGSGDRAGHTALVDGLTEDDTLEQIGRAFLRDSPITFDEVYDPDCPGWLLDFAADDHRQGIRPAVASHLNCPPSTLARLAVDPRLDVAAAAGTNPSLPDGTRRLSDWAVVEDGRVVLSTDDSALAATVALSLNHPLYRCKDTAYPSCNDVFIVLLVEPSEMTDINRNPTDVVPAGVYVVNDLDPGEGAEIVLPDGSRGWVDGDALGPRCSACDGKGNQVSYTMDGEFVTNPCDDCEGVGRVRPPLPADMTEIPAPDHPAWWLS